MKKPLLLLFAVCLTASATAAPRDRAAALRLAQQSAATQGATVTPVAAAKGNGTSSSSTAPYYIFNKDNDKGFIIVSGDDRMPDVLGYTDNGSFNEATAPDGLKFVLKAFAKTTEALQKGNGNVARRMAEVTKRKAVVNTKVDALLKSKWSQYSPFNTYCPVYDSTAYKNDRTGISGHSAAGCVPAALAQVMYYYQWPKQTKAEIPAYTTQTRKFNIPAVPAGTAYEWDKMLAVYNGLGSANARRACGTLLANIGQSLKADYADDAADGNYGETGADFSIRPIINYFDYDADLVSQQYMRNYDLATWQLLIANELKAGRPVPYEAYSEDDSGHAWVVDGVDTDGKFHCNWGWAGLDDGWFFIDAMIGDGITWNVDADAVIGMIPNNNVTDAHPLYSLLQLSVPDEEDYPQYQPSFTVNGDREMGDENFTGSVRYVFTNSSRSQAFNGYVALGVEEDGGIKIISDSKQVTCPASQRRSPSYVTVDLSYDYAFPEGSARLLYPMVSYDGENWIPAQGINTYAYEVQATETTLTGSYDGMQEVTITPTSGTFDGMVVNQTYQFVYTVKNNSNIRTLSSHWVTLIWQNEDDDDDYGDIVYYNDDPGFIQVGSCAPGATLTYTFNYTPTKAGTFYIYSEDEDSEKLLAESDVFTVSDPTGITEIKSDTMSADNSWYTVDGKRISTKLAKRGLYIHHGKKVVVNK